MEKCFGHFENRFFCEINKNKIDGKCSTNSIFILSLHFLYEQMFQFLISRVEIFNQAKNWYVLVFLSFVDGLHFMLWLRCIGIYFNIKLIEEVVVGLNDAHNKSQRNINIFFKQIIVIWKNKSKIIKLEKKIQNWNIFFSVCDRIKQLSSLSKVIAYKCNEKLIQNLLLFSTNWIFPEIFCLSGNNNWIYLNEYIFFFQNR